ncbi:hypothetical protein P7C70_g5302, partial [Phenoliferia sp. Uapishka_3]
MGSLLYEKTGYDERKEELSVVRPASPSPVPLDPPPPAFLRRLMDDYARQLRIAQNRGADRAGESAHDGPTSVVDRPAGSSSTYSYPASSVSSMSDVSPRSFSYYAGSTSSISSVGSSSVIMSSPTALCLPRATLDDAAVAAAHTTKSVPVGSSTPIFTHAQRLENVYTLPKEIAIEETLLPPQNFAMVSSFVYRSSFPARKNFPFLRSLGLKSVLTLILEEYPEPNLEFLDAEGIKFFQFGIPGNKEPFVQIPDEKIVAALAVIFDVRNHPILIHCNKGKVCVQPFMSYQLAALVKSNSLTNSKAEIDQDAYGLRAMGLMKGVKDRGLGGEVTSDGGGAEGACI